MTSPHPLDSIKPLAGKALETALNRVLALDADTRADLTALDGRRIELALSAPALALAITVQDASLRVGPANAGDASPPDLSLRGTLGALLGQLPFFADSGTAPGGRVHVSGDAELAQRLQKMARGFAPDWGKPFADAFGDVWGGLMAKGVQQAFSAGIGSARTFARDAADYLTEESRDIASRVELDAFHDEVDALRDDVERLAVRLERLSRGVPEASR